MYYCQGADFNHYDAGSDEFSQGLPEGYVYSIEHISPMNMNFQIDLDFKNDASEEATIVLQGIL